MGGSLGLSILVTVFGTTVRQAAGIGGSALVLGMTHAFAASAGFAACTFLVALTFRR